MLKGLGTSHEGGDAMTVVAMHAATNSDATARITSSGCG
jgi:hypothetical protein